MKRCCNLSKALSVSNEITVFFFSFCLFIWSIMFIDLQFSLEKIFHGFVENTSCIFDLGVLSFFFSYSYICSFHNVLEILNILCLVFCGFNIFFDRDIHFFYHVFNAWDSLFHLLYSAVKLFSKKFLKFSFPYFPQFGIYLLVLWSEALSWRFPENACWSWKQW